MSSECGIVLGMAIIKSTQRNRFRKELKNSSKSAPTSLFLRREKSERSDSVSIVQADRGKASHWPKITSKKSEIGVEPTLLIT
jgi:Ni,Fe-hydrogenase I large subunit